MAVVKKNSAPRSTAEPCTRMRLDMATPELPNNEKTGLEGKECVPFFSSETAQIKFEFWYLVTLFLLAATATLAIQYFAEPWSISHSDKVSLFALAGGFFGGWVYDAKWFYRVTARGRNNQYAFVWQSHKFYWRVLTPFLSGIVAFSTFLLCTTDFLPLALKNKDSAKAAFSVSFLFGYFSDLVLSRLAAWAEQVIPKSNQ